MRVGTHGSCVRGGEDGYLVYISMLLADARAVRPYTGGEP